MNKKYSVRLSSDERDMLHGAIKRLSGSSQKVRRAQMLLKADADGPCWTDQHIAEAFNCRVKTVENLRRRFVEQGFERVLNGQRRANPPVAKLLNGEQEAKVIAMRLGSPPAGYGQWTLRLLARKLIDRQLVKRIEFCYTPKHGSWLNVAENELSAMTRQCLAHRRMADIETLQEEINAWSEDVNQSQKGVDWQLKIDDVRCKLKSVYPNSLS